MITFRDLNRRPSENERSFKQLLTDQCLALQQEQLRSLINLSISLFDNSDFQLQMPCIKIRSCLFVVNQPILRLGVYFQYTVLARGGFCSETIRDEMEIFATSSEEEQELAFARY
jgi:hypothetical protein